jgi:vancomycin resistance protein YoaR
MATSRKRAALFVAVPLMILLMPLTIYAIDSAAASDKVARNVSVAGVDVSRYSRADAIAAVDAYTAELMGRTVIVSVDGTTFELDPADVGVTFATAQAVDTAMVQNSDGITDWIRAFGDEVDVPIAASLDPEMLEDVLVAWEEAAIENPAFEGSITITGSDVDLEYPEDGEAIDRNDAATLILEAVESASDEAVILPTATATPSLTDADLDAAAEEARRIMDTPVVLTQDEYGFTFRVSASDIARSLDARVVKGDPSSIEFTFDHAVFRPLIEAARPELELAPQDAYWETTLVDDFEDWDENYEITDSPQDDIGGLPDDDQIVLVPDKNGTTIDVQAVANAVEEAARGTGSGELPIVLDAPAAFTTEMAEAYGELYEVSEFTTYKPGVNRAHNIDLMADLIDDTIVWPGESFSVNDFVGRRTIEKGFRYDCAIVSGELSCEEDPVNVGGGVSQFGTTIFNAIYFGCYEVVTHQPHSIYFSKYPEGREATLGYPSPDVAFTNDSNAPVIIRTSHTNRSITVTFFGNQEGRFCGTERSERMNVSPPVLEYQADEDGVVRPGEEQVKSRGSKGWTVINTRIFYDAEGNEIDREEFPWRYRGEKNVILLHPCDPRVGGNGVCPIRVPSLGGLGQAEASAALGAAGFEVVVTLQDTDDPAKDGVVLAASPTGFQDPGTAITITIGRYTAPPDDGGGGDAGGGDAGGGDAGGGDGG